MHPTFISRRPLATTLPSEPDEREEFLTPLQQKRRMFLGPIINGGPEGLKLLGRRTLQVIGVIVYPVRLVRERRDCTISCSCGLPDSPPMQVYTALSWLLHWAWQGTQWLASAAWAMGGRIRARVPFTVFPEPVCNAADVAVNATVNAVNGTFAWLWRES